MTPEELVGRYVGEQKIQAVGEKNPDGKVTVTFEDGKTLYVHLAVVSDWATVTPKDATSLRELKIVPLVVAIITAMQDHQLRKADMDYLAMKVNETIRQAEKQAEDLLWGKDKDDLTINDMEQILLKNKTS